MLGCNVDVFGITSKLKEAHLYLIQLRERRVFWNASSTSKLYWYGSPSIQMPTQLASTVMRRNEGATHD
eukprot:scaffold1376_cov236-Skeletonema_marinoi.AAC.1